MKFISFPIFLVSLAIGLFIVYISLPKMKIIYVYPTPDNEDKITYQDKADNCFHFKSIEIDCPNDETKIRSYNIQ
jgi:hypothetical protein|tara:strand:+ start:606 stop:830 length:225 start_codon:yes stop_codon:yes gene_type:complete